MASIKKYKTAKGTAWRVQYRSPDGKSRTKQGFDTKAHAEAWAAKNTIAINDGTWVDPHKAKMHVSEFKELFFDTKKHLAEGSLSSMETSWETWVKPKWGTRAVSSIQRSEVQTWLSANSKKASTIRRAHGILAGVLDLAVEHGCMVRNPARGVTLPRKPQPRHVYLTAEQLGTLAEQCGPHGLLVLLLGTSGMRWSEATGLKVRDVPDVGNRIRLVRAAKWVERGLVVGELKGHDGRVVSVAPAIMEQLRLVVDGRGLDEWVFPGSEGEPLKQLGHHSWFYRRVKELVESGTLPAKLSPHGLRHVAAGLMISSGANVKVVQRQLGHKDAAMTLNTYADLFDDDLDQVGVRLGEAISNVVELSWDGVSRVKKKDVQAG